MSKLIEHAEHELIKAGLFDKDSYYRGMLGDAILELIKVFSNQGHSGHSGQLTLSLFVELANYRHLKSKEGEHYEHRYRVVTPEQFSDGYLEKIGMIAHKRTFEKVRLLDDGNILVKEVITENDES